MDVNVQNTSNCANKLQNLYGQNPDLTQQADQLRRERGRIMAEAEKALQVEKAKLEQAKRDAEEFQKDERVKLEKLQREADIQIRRHREEAERLAAQSRAEYEGELNAANLEIERLKIETEKQTRWTQEELQMANQEAQHHPAQSARGGQGVPRPRPPRPGANMQMSPPPPPRLVSYVQDSTAVVQNTPELSQPAVTAQRDIPTPIWTTERYESTAPSEPQPTSSQVSIHRNTETPKPHPCGITPIVECCNTSVSIPLDWFAHSLAPSFTVCSRCYVDHIYNSPLRSDFTLKRSTAGESRLCMFGAPRVKEHLWLQSKSSGNFSNVLEFMTRRGSMQPCPEKQLQQKRNRYVSEYIKGTTLCEACFEDHLGHAPFRSYFKLQEADSIEDQWYCDCSVWFVRRCMDENVKAGNWNKFAADTQARLQLLECPKLVSAVVSQRTWYIASRGPPGLQVCHACFADYFFETPAAKHFAIGQPEGPNGTAICVMGHLNILLPTMRASGKEDWELFWTAMDQLGANSICSGTGTTNATWFTTKNNPADFAICGACMGSIVTALGGARYFIPKPGASRNDTFVCNFNTSKPRWQQFLQNFSEVLFTGKPDSLEQAAQTWASVPLCPRYDLKKPGNRKWWGWEDLQICEECYLSFAKGTKFEDQFPMKGLLIEESRICDLYSPRMRGRYTEACQEDTLPVLLGFAHKRRSVFLETIPQCEQILMTQFFKAQQAKMLGITGSFYKAIGGAQAAINGYDYNVGNAQVGYGWKNETEFTGAMYDHQMRQVASEVGGGGPLMMIQVLEQRWKQVE